MLKIYYEWSVGVRYLDVDPPPGYLFRHAAVRLKNGEYRMMPFGGFVHTVDLDRRSWQRIKVKANLIDSLNEQYPELRHSMTRIESGHVLGVVLHGSARVVLGPEKLMVIPV